MRYIELTLDTPRDEIEIRCEQLTELGAGGFVIENGDDFNEFLENNKQYWDYVDEDLAHKFDGVSRIKCYLTDDEAGITIVKNIRSSYPDAAIGYIADSDWENNWKEFYKPIEVGKKLVIVPEWEDIPENGRIPLLLDPGLIFGTGSHATTKMCLRSMEDYITTETRILDLGCGSGILGIGALVLGAKNCVGCDIDPKAPDVVMSNAALNGIGNDRMKAYAGDVTSDIKLMDEIGGGYDIVFANIVADVIVNLAPHVRKHMKDGGLFITSGIIDYRGEEVKQVLLDCGFEIIDRLYEDEWQCFVCK